MSDNPSSSGIQYSCGKCGVIEFSNKAVTGAANLLNEGKRALGSCVFRLSAMRLTLAMLNCA